MLHSITVLKTGQALIINDCHASVNAATSFFSISLPPISEQ
jgi:hypothetical protein